MQSTGPSALGKLEQVESAIENPNCVQEVLNAYTAAKARTNAFDVAVAAYRVHNPEVSDTAARQTVAGIICGIGGKL